MSKINEVAELVEKGKAKLVGPAVQEAIDEGDDPVAILNDGMMSRPSDIHISSVLKSQLRKLFGFERICRGCSNS